MNNPHQAAICPQKLATWPYLLRQAPPTEAPLGASTVRRKNSALWSSSSEPDCTWKQQQGTRDDHKGGWYGNHGGNDDKIGVNDL